MEDRILKGIQKQAQIEEWETTEAPHTFVYGTFRWEGSLPAFTGLLVEQLKQPLQSFS